MIYPYNVFVDLDGVLADFDKRFREFFTLTFAECEKLYGDDEAWNMVSTIPNFWHDLELMPGAHDLWNAVNEKFHPIILTSPSKRDYARAIPGKRQWVDKHFGRVPILFRRGKRKHELANSASILIDDWPSNIANWSKAGGHAIHHKSVDQTLEKLSHITSQPADYSYIAR